MDRYFDEISQYVVQLWLILSEEPLQFRPHASAVLVEMNGRKYLLTAGHVLDDIDLKYLCFFENDDLVKVQGEVTYLSNKVKENINGDIAAYLLEDENAAELSKHYKFLPFDRVLMNHLLSREPRYFIVGYPVSQSKKWFQKKIIRINSLRFNTRGIIDSKKMKRLGLDPQVNFMVEFHRRKCSNLWDVKNQKQYLPAPNGLSGAALWYIDDDKVMKLVGIMTGYNFVETVMTASRIDLATEMIRHRFDHSVEKTRVINVKWD